MISKRTGIILIVAIAAILIFETNFGLDKMNDTLDNMDHTNTQITLKLDGEIVDLEGTKVTYNYAGAKEPISTNLSKLNETGYENLPNNSAAFKPCGKGANKLSFTVPKKLIPTYSSDLNVTFGFENNQSEFNNYSLIINLTTMDESSIKADITQTVYYPNDKGETQSKKTETSTVVNQENSNIDCTIK